MYNQGDVVIEGRKNNSSIDIYANCVELSQDGIKKTKLMRIAKLNFEQLEKYLEDVLLYQLIKADNGNYRATDRGKEFLKHYHIMRSYLRPGNSPIYTPPSKPQDSTPYAVNQKKGKKGGNRTFYDIFCDIIEKCARKSNGAKKTNLMYDAGLNTKKLEEYKNRLTKLGFIKEKDNKIWATEAGMKFLEEYGTMKSYLREPSDDSVSVLVPKIMSNGTGGFVTKLRQFN